MILTVSSETFVAVAPFYSNAVKMFASCFEQARGGNQNLPCHISMSCCDYAKYQTT